jgi:2,4-dienoyl-CoA reductase-like NADH-dependent reductase (Old Yellow Enzyme family)
VLEHLLSPLRVGPAELANRIVSTAHQTGLLRAGLPTEDFVAYHEARARGGTGLIVLEATAVHPSGLLTPPARWTRPCGSPRRRPHVVRSPGPKMR